MDIVKKLEDERNQAVEDLERALDQIARLANLVSKAMETPSRECVASATHSGNPGVVYFRQLGYSKTQAKALSLYSKIRRQIMKDW